MMVPRVVAQASMINCTGKAVANEKTNPYLVELIVPPQGLDVALSRQIMAFHSARNVRPRFGRTSFRNGANYHRWCFSDLETARAFHEQFGGEFHGKLE